jgi:hypothetical protein
MKSVVEMFSDKRSEVELIINDKSVPYIGQCERQNIHMEGERGEVNFL